MTLNPNGDADNKIANTYSEIVNEPTLLAKDISFFSRRPMYRCWTGISFIASFFAPFILAMDLPYGDFDGLAVDEAIHYFDPCADDFSARSNISEDDGYAWDHDAYVSLSHHFDYCANNNNDVYTDEQEVDAQKDSRNETSCLNENDFDADDFQCFFDDTDEEPCSPYMHDDGADDGKNDRREKRARDMKKDRPYRIEYIESIRSLDCDLLTGQAKRQFYKDARKNYLTNKLSIKKAANLGPQKTYHRRQNKIESAFRKINIEHQKENTRNNSDSKIFALAKGALTFDKRKCLDKSNTWQKNGPEVIIDQRCQNLEKTPQIRQVTNKIKFITQKKPRKNFPIKQPKQFDPINCPSRQQESLKFSPSQKILRRVPMKRSCHPPIYFWTSSTMPYFGG